MPKTKTLTSQPAAMAPRPTVPNGRAASTEWTSRIAPDIRRIGLRRWFTRWFLSVSAAIGHVWGLTWLSTHISSAWLFYAAVLAPALITAVLRPRASLFRWYRWVAIYALVLASSAGDIVLIGAEAWALAAFFAPAVAAAASPAASKADRRMALRPAAKRSGSAIPLTGMWKLSQFVAGKVVRGGSR